jgi:hypothetical protein
VPVELKDEDIFLGPDDEPPNRPRRAGRRRVERLRPLPGPYVRVPVQWLVKPHFVSSFNAEGRLHLYLLYRSHWGQREVRVTEVLAAEIGLLRRTCQDALAQLERKGWVRVERHKGRAPVVLPVVLSVQKSATANR